MLKLDAYNGLQLQAFSSLLSSCISAGFSDTGTAKEYVDRHINDTLRLQATDVLVAKNVKRDTVTRCPSCGKGILNPVKNNAGLTIIGCHVCRYSEVVK